MKVPLKSDHAPPPVSSKFSRFESGHFIEHRYQNTWSREKTTGPDRLIIAPASNHIDLMVNLMEDTSGPFGFLYVLLVGFCDQPTGRYESPYAVEMREAVAFLREFTEFFENDGRHHLWVMSLKDQSTLVYDQHNQIYAYGQLDPWIQRLERLGFQMGDTSIPYPHTHGFNPKRDEFQEKLMSRWTWRHYPLVEGVDNP